MTEDGPTELLKVAVTLTAHGLMDVDRWGDPIYAERVEWRATAGPRGAVVGVTAYGAAHQNRSWMDPRFFVAAGLNSERPPDWVPSAPDCFWSAVEGLRAPCHEVGE